ncbi:MAG TPA: double zinc ribbon domain-containing protein, partial [Rhizomicrobium sp.]|nr:double zinc ribbon domain-containing protein [Rhizomicrobium sp.]
MSGGLQGGIRRVGRAVLDFVYPPLCIACRAQVAEPGALCAECWQKIRFLDGPMCARCGLPFDFDFGPDTLCAACLARPPFFDKARAVMRYDEFSRGPILALKHGD